MCLSLCLCLTFMQTTRRSEVGSVATGHNYFPRAILPAKVNSHEVLLKFIVCTFSLDSINKEVKTDRHEDHERRCHHEGPKDGAFQVARWAVDEMGIGTFVLWCWCECWYGVGVGVLVCWC
jgi:hypothetical protein